MNTFTLPIGDWSKDGHNQSEDIMIETEFSQKDIMEAYLKTVNELKVSLHRDHKLKGVQPILCEYEEGEIPEDVEEILTKAGYKDKHDDDGGAEMVVDLFIWFVKQSLPKFTCKIIKKKHLFGFWDAKYNFSMGYGVFGS